MTHPFSINIWRRSNALKRMLMVERQLLQACFTCRRPSSVLWMVTHLLGWTPLVVMAVMRESSSSFFSFSFLTKLSMARLAKPSFSPPCRWHMRLCTILRQASLLLGGFTDILLLWQMGKQNSSINTWHLVCQRAVNAVVMLHGH